MSILRLMNWNIIKSLNDEANVNMIVRLFCMILYHGLWTLEG